MIAGEGTPTRADRARDAGNAVVETAIPAPVFIMLLAGLLVVIRATHGSAVVARAAADAARQASIARTAHRAWAEANTSALHTLRDRGAALNAFDPTRPVRFQPLTLVTERCAGEFATGLTQQWAEAQLPL